MNPSTALASVLIDELVRGGVREVVLAPGSRSAPLAYAAAAAEAAGRLRLHVRVDERSAGFLALGLALGSARPVPVITTSGTAVANLHPAVLEAHHSQVPLIVISADRPAELRGTGANQTTVQPGIFGVGVRWLYDLPAPESADGLNSAWRSTVCRALAAAAGATGSIPGPVHLNVGFRDPLVPDVEVHALGTPEAAGGGLAERDLARPDLGPDLGPDLAGRDGDRPWVRVDGAPGALRATGEPIEHCPRTLVVVGSLPRPEQSVAALAWARGRGYPVIAEPFGRIAPGALPGGPLLLTHHAWLAKAVPDRVIVIGRPTLSRPVSALLRRPGMRVEVVHSGGDWPDPSHVAEQVHPFTALGADFEHEADLAWGEIWRAAGERIAALTSEIPWSTSLSVAAAVSGSLPGGSTLVVGSSTAARDLDLTLDRTTPRDLVVLANRGLAGIDGMVSTASGVALAGDRPTYALLGDLTFLHDTNGLLLGDSEPAPDLTIVVVNDDGGGIFTLLEHGAPERANTFERIFGTPTGTDVAALCRAHGVRHERVADPGQLSGLVAERPRGLSVLEVPVDRSGHRAAHAALRQAVADALG